MPKYKKFFFGQTFFLLALSIISGFIFLTNLSGQGFSLDEPETIIISKSILKSGLPLAWDGKNFISLNNGLDSAFILGKYIWSWHPFLQHYLTAGSIYLFGFYEWSARLPFAFFAILTVLLTYFVSIELFKKKILAFFISFQLIFLMPFFLYVRQARYYSLTAFFSLGLFLLLLKLIKNKWPAKGNFYFLLVGLFLFFSDFVVWLSSIVAFFFILLINKIKVKKEIYFILLLEFLLAFAWFLIFRPYGGNIFLFSTVRKSFWLGLEKYISYINAYLFPLILLPFLLFIWKKEKLVFLIFFWLTIKIFFYTLFLNPHGRYLVDLFPIFIISFGFLYNFLWEKKSFFLLICLFLLLFSSNILNIGINKFIIGKKNEINFWPNNYFKELTFKGQETISKIGSYLNLRYKNGDLFWSNNYIWNIYLASDVPSVSPVCRNGKLAGPQEVIRTDKIRWLIFFKFDNRLAQEFSAVNCFGKGWDENLKKNYHKINLNLANSFPVNDPDIANRKVPPQAVNTGIVIYEKN